METKYIITENGSAILFSEAQSHCDFREFKPVSAGFVQIYTPKGLDEIVVGCYGRSLSLDLPSNPEVDAKLIKRQIIGN